MDSRGWKSHRIAPNMNASKETKSVEPILNDLNPIKIDSETNRKVQKRPNSVESTSIENWPNFENQTPKRKNNFTVDFMKFFVAKLDFNTKPNCNAWSLGMKHWWFMSFSGRTVIRPILASELWAWQSPYTNFNVSIPTWYAFTASMQLELVISRKWFDTKKLSYFSILQTRTWKYLSY